MTPLAATKAERLERARFDAWAADNLPQYLGPRQPTWAIVEANVRAEAWAAWKYRASQQSAAQATAEPVAWISEKNLAAIQGKGMAYATGFDIGGQVPLFLAAPDRAPSTIKK